MIKVTKVRSALNHARPKAVRQRRRGFTLIEVMIVVAIVAILAAIAIPSYRDYVLRGQLVDATTLLSTGRANMERYFQDNRTYAQVGTMTPPCNNVVLGLFTLSCNTPAPDLNGYTLTASGSGSVAGFTYTVTQADVRTTIVNGHTGWSTPNPNTCWIVKRGQAC